MAQYSITINNGGGSSVGKRSSPAISNNAAPQGTAASGAESDTSGKKLVRKSIAALDIAKRAVFTAANFRANTVELRHGNQALQERMQFYTGMAERGVNLFESIAVGAALGGGFGAVAGAVISVAQSAITYAQSASRIELERTVESGSIRLANIRAGGAPRGGGSN